MTNHGHREHRDTAERGSAEPERDDANRDDANRHDANRHDANRRDANREDANRARDAGSSRRSTHEPVTSAMAGEAIIGADVVGTVVFVATAVIAAASFSTAAQWVGAITAMSLFVVGVAAFLWAFYNAVQRSRSEQVSVTQLFLLLGGVAPRRVRRVMLSLLLVQFVTALATTLARPDGPDGNPGSSLAVGFLVPMFGFGLNGIWAAFHGRFEIRDDEEALAARADGDSTASTVRTRQRSIGKNEHHG